MKKKLLLFLLPIFLSAIQCYGQQGHPPKKWELGIDALSLFNKNQYPAYSIFVARKIGENGLALRSRIGIEGSSFENLTVVPPRSPYPRPDNFQKRNYFASLGIQKSLWLNSQSNNQSYFYSGVDLGININQESTQKLESVGNFNELYDERTGTYTGYILSPFLGYSHNLIKNFSIRIEMAANLTITNYKLRGYGWFMPRYDQTAPFIPPINENISAYEYGNSRSIKYGLNPFNQIILSYSF